MNTKTFSEMDPYQLLFPLGALHAVVGAALWVLFALKITPYPLEIHSHHMLAGFLLSFVTGFLMTAIPSFTGTHRRSDAELAVAVALSIATLVTTSYIPTCLTLIFLGVFFARRIATRSATPPPHFIFIPLGLLLGLSGAVLATLWQWGLASASAMAAARILLFYGMVLSLLLGIGAKLVSAFLGWCAPPIHRGPATRKSLRIDAAHRTMMHRAPYLQALLLLSGLVLEIAHYPTAGRLLEALCATWIGLRNWHLYRLPIARGKLPFWTWISSWVLLIGLWSHALFPSLGIHAAHLIFIGGFGLTTLLVASRVTLAHSGQGIALESTSRIYAAFAVLAVLAAFTRFLAPWTPSYYSHLGYAAALWVVAVLSWCVFFIPRMFASTGAR